MKVIIATAHTMEQWENWSSTLGVFSSIDGFEKWLSENFLVVDVHVIEDGFNTYYIHDKEAKTDNGGETYYTEYECEDGEVYQELDVGDFVKLEEFEVVGESQLTENIRHTLKH